VCGTHETLQEIGDVGHPTFSCRYRKPVIDLPTRDRESAARDDKTKFAALRAVVSHPILRCRCTVKSVIPTTQGGKGIRFVISQ
jgi:hypothetical protein